MRKLLLFVQDARTAQRLKRTIPGSQAMWAGLHPETIEDIIERFERDPDLPVLITTRGMLTGWRARVDAEVLFTFALSPTERAQGRGRVGSDLDPRA